MSSTSKFKGGKRKKNRLENFSSSRSLFPLLSTFFDREHVAPRSWKSISCYCWLTWTFPQLLSFFCFLSIDTLDRGQHWNSFSVLFQFNLIRHGWLTWVLLFVLWFGSFWSRLLEKVNDRHQGAFKKSIRRSCCCSWRSLERSNLEKRMKEKKSRALQNPPEDVESRKLSASFFTIHLSKNV